jgi:hypothetical protein
MVNLYFVAESRAQAAFLDKRNGPNPAKTIAPPAPGIHPTLVVRISTDKKEAP